MVIKIMTYNIRRAGEEKVPANLWESRRDFVIGLIEKNRPDILCVQEDGPAQIAEIKERFGNFDSFGYYNEKLDSGIFGEANTIFFDRGKFELLDKKNFYLTDTPDKESKLEGQSRHNRTVSYARLKHGGEAISVFNTHFDHLSDVIQEKEAAVLVGIIGSIKPEHYIICGDFNGDSESRQMKILGDNFNLASGDVADRVTIIDWSESHPPRKCLDFIFSDLAKKTALADDFTYLAADGERRAPSDHLPIVCELEVRD